MYHAFMNLVNLDRENFNTISRRLQEFPKDPRDPVDYKCATASISFVYPELNFVIVLIRYIEYLTDITTYI